MLPEDELRSLLDALHRADDRRMSTPRTSPDYEQAADRVDELAQAIWRMVRTEGPESDGPGRPRSGGTGRSLTTSR